MGPSLFNISINDLYKEIKRTLSHVPGDAKVGQSVGLVERKKALKRAKVSCKKFSEVQITGSCIWVTRSTCSTTHLGEE